MAAAPDTAETDAAAPEAAETNAAETNAAAPDIAGTDAAETDAAETDAAETDVDAPFDGADCPRLFGTETLAQRHAARRGQILWGVEGASRVVEVEHSAGWDRPHYLELRGLELVDAVPGGEATFRVKATLERPGCEAGEYALGVDDSLGERGHVLAVLNDVVLVEYLGQLSYLATPEARIPTWRMVWRSPWKIVRRRHTGVASSTVPTYRRNVPVRRRGRR